MTEPLSDAVEARLVLLFPEQEQETVRRLLQDDGAAPDVAPLGERVQIAILKLSGGTMDGLSSAIRLARTDWRDALVAAEFADDVTAHERWWPGD